MNVISIVIQIFVLLFAITVHEASHGWAAKKMGDPTAFNMGRVTLNPLAHIDPFGTVLLPLLLSLARMPAFGWAKPVPVNPDNFRNPRRGNLWVSFAGPAANIAVALTSLILLLGMKLALPNVGLFIKALINGFFRQMGFLLPVLPRGFFPLEGLALILIMMVLINSYFALFNLIPVPPLDGSGVLMGLLSDNAASRYARIRPFGFIIVLFLIYMGLLDILIWPVKLMIVIVLG
ncbi:MAG: site-2 protease family protein [Candidatus Aminicenantes bacterium]|nr:site-2 protease family protein [Candidatus Aminicenantes bacterium]